MTYFHPRCARIRYSAASALKLFLIALMAACFSARLAAAQEQDGTEEEGAAWKNRLDSANGALNQSIDIEVPPFRGLEPSISLSYDSSGENGFVGIGWRLGGLSVIERASPRFGTPRYDSTDIFYLDGDELKPCVAGMTSPSCTTGGTHTTRIESFLKIRRDTAAKTWEVWNRDGTKLTYQRVGIWGSYNPTDPDAVKRATDYRWLLQTVTDTHNQTVTYGYQCDGVPDCYVDTIAYNGNTIKFYRESRPDPISYATGAGLAQINFRLKSIDVLVGGQRARALALTYATATGSARSKLASVQQFGKTATVNTTTGAVSGGPSLPPTSFTYQDSAGSFTGSSWVASVALRSRGDFNGDGRMDYVQQYPTSSTTAGCTFDLRISNDTSYAVQTWSVSTTASGMEKTNVCTAAAGEYWMSGDFNGDGKIDLASKCNVGGNAVTPGQESIRTYLSTGSGFASALWLGPSGACNVDDPSNKLPVIDINGDGLADLGRNQLSKNGSTCNLSTHRSTGSSFVSESWPVTTTTCPDTGHWERDDDGQNVWVNDPMNLTPGDFNGDGKTDYHSSYTPYQTNDFSVYVFISQSASFSLQTWMFSSTGSNSIWAGTTGSKFGDFNGDGRTDFARHKYDTSNTPDIDVYLSTGSTFVKQRWASSQAGGGIGTKTTVIGGNTIITSSEWATGDFTGDGRDDLAVSTIKSPWLLYVYKSLGTSFVLESWSPLIHNNELSANLSPGDINGDGKQDLINKYAAGNDIDVYLSGGPVPDLLTGVTNSLGGTTAIAYTPSSAWANTNLPFIVQTVSSVTVNDGRGNSSTTDYSYAGGLRDAPLRRFLGFASMTATLPDNLDGNGRPKIVTTYLQNACAYTAPTEIQEKNSAGAILRRSLEEYTVDSTACKTLNTASSLYVYEGAANRQAKVTRTFDAYGNVTQSINHGDFGAGATGDEVTTATDMTVSTSAYIVNRPGRVRTFAGAGTTGAKLAESQIYYDGAAAYTTAPTKGDPTKSRAWLTGTTYIDSTAEYHPNGNVKANIDPLGNRTEFIYETTYNLFVTETRFPPYFLGDLRFSTLSSWDVRCATQTQSVDFNDQATTTTYDDLCRPTNTTTPGGNFTTTTYNNIGSPTAQFIETQTPPADGTPNNLWARAYMDGLGRDYEARVKGPATGDDIIAVTGFNKRGAVSSRTAPYYDGDTAVTTTYAFDQLDRPIRLTHPDASFAQTGYGLGDVFESVTATDELGRAVTLHNDAYGRTVFRDQILSGATVTTEYEWDLLGRLTGVIDNAGNHWVYTYDSLGRRLTASDPDAGFWTYAYDNAGRLTLQTDALGQKTRLTYDSMGRVLTKKARADTAQEVVTTNTYDEERAGFHNVGRLTTASNPAAIIKYDYDKDGRVKRQTHTVGGVNYVTSSAYDIGGRLLSITYPDGQTVGTMAYDPAGRLKSVPGLLEGTTYTARNQPDQVNRPGTADTDYTYSGPRGWLERIVTTGVQDIQYTRDVAGRITKVASTTPGESWSYGYDDLDRLTCANNFSGPPLSTCVAGQGTSLSQTFTYDSVGNMLSNSALGSYTYPLPGNPRPHAVTQAGTRLYVYDANGNMIENAGQTVVYDGENRPINVGGTLFEYGPDGQRLKKTDAGVTTLYLGADVELSGTTWTKYLPGDAIRTGTTTKWLHRDHLNSVRGYTDSAGVLKERANFRPYGERLVTLGIISASKGFIGERHDDETGLIYLNARYYDPVLARFIQPDPLDPILPGVDVNRYAYAGNNPIGRVDPSGFSYKNFPTKEAYDAEQHSVAKARETINDLDALSREIYGDSLQAPEESQSELARLADDIRFTREYQDANATLAVHAIREKYGWRAARDWGSWVRAQANQNSITTLDGEDVSPRDIARLAVVIAVVATADKLLGDEGKQYRGGAFKDIKEPGLERHHMPGRTVTGLPADEGPAGQMEKEDHKKTAGWGSSKSAKEYREMQRALINSGNFRAALEMDFADLKDKFGTKYDRMIRDVRRYAERYFNR